MEPLVGVVCRKFASEIRLERLADTATPNRQAYLKRRLDGRRDDVAHLDPSPLVKVSDHAS